MDWTRESGKAGGATRWARWILVIAGLLSVAAGIIVLAEPAIALATLAVITGIFLVIDGVTETALALFEDGDDRFVRVLAAVIALLVGVIMIRHPIPGVVAVGMLLGLWLIASGAVRLAASAREPQLRGWWLLVAVIEIAAGDPIAAT
jgi:uncharacterized membrane protein HdeD (DUF308 family)